MAARGGGAGYDQLHHFVAAGMRTTFSKSSARLYHFSEDAAAAQTVFYGSMSEALIVARQQPEALQTGLWLATENDVVAFLDLEEG